MCKMHAEPNETSAGRWKLPRLARITAFSGGLLLTALLVAESGVPGHAAVPQDDLFAGLEVLEAAEMAEKRGGFFDAILGISLGLGADIVTTINGTVKLTTTFTAFDAPPTYALTVPDGFDLASLTFINSDGSGVDVGGGITIVGQASTTLSIPGGPQITVPAGFGGLTWKGDKGIIAGVHKITQAQIANLVINSNPVDPSSADPLSSVQQELTFKIDVDGFSGLQANVRLNATLTRFRDAMRSASLGALGAN
jgi:hypothetical protein